MLITLWRHGEAAYSRPDSQRELTDQGSRHVRASVGLYRSLCERGGLSLPTVCVHSPYSRTHQTANLIAGELRLSEVVARNTLAPGQIDYVSGDFLSENAEHQLIVGHQPYLSQLIEVWCDISGHISFSPSGFAIIELHVPCRGGGVLLHHESEGYSR